MSNYIYGIDFGTTNSSLAILDLKTNNIVKVFSIPSLLFFPREQESRKKISCTIGEKAIENYVESRMSGRFMKSIKKVLPKKSFTKTEIFSQYYRAEDLVALIVRRLKEDADAFLGEDVKTAVFGRPVVFDVKPDKDALAQKRLSKAAKIAGFETFYFQLEPIGAAFSYERQITKDELVLVGDFGGGTSDFTLMKLRPDAIKNADRKEDMLSTGGIYIGGDNFDSKIMWHRGTPHFGRGVKEKSNDKWLDLPSTYFTNICSWEKMNFLNSLQMSTAIRKSYLFSGRNEQVKNLMTLIDKNLGYSLFREIEKTKISLTNNDLATLEYLEHGIICKESISIEDFTTQIINKEVNKIENYLDKYLNDNNISYEDIDTVFMTGGTSMVRPIRDMFVKKFGAEKLKSGDNFNSVAIGLAYSYGVVGS